MIFVGEQTNWILQNKNKNKNNITWKQNKICGVSLGASFIVIVFKKEKLFVPQESSFLIPLKYVDFVRQTNTTLDVLQCGQIYDNWNVDGVRQLSGPWTVFAQFTFLDTTPPQAYIMWSRGEMNKDRSNVQAPEHVARSLVACGQEIMEKRTAALAKGTPKLDNARKLKGIFFF